MSETTEQVDASAATEPAGGWDGAIAASAEAHAEPPKLVRRLVRWKLEAPRRLLEAKDAAVRAFLAKETP